NNTKAEGKAQIHLTIVDGPIEQFPFPLGFAATRERELALTSDPIKPGGQTMLSFDVVADGGCGVARVRLSASLGDESYAEAVELPVRPASPAVSVGGYAVATTTQPARIALDAEMLKGTINGTQRWQVNV